MNAQNASFTQDCRPVTLPEGIEVEHDFRGDGYIGTKDQLIAAGLVREEHFPIKGRFADRYVRGERVVRKGSVREDEHFLRIQRWHEKGRFSVRVGVSAEVARQRIDAFRARQRSHEETTAQVERAKAADEARARLKGIPRTAEAFRRNVVRDVRSMVRAAVVHMPTYGHHGYAFTDDALAAVLLSVDAVIEAVMQSDVVLDHAMHVELVSSLQLAIASDAGDISAKVARLVVPNAAVLVDEARP